MVSATVTTPVDATTSDSLGALFWLRALGSFALSRGDSTAAVAPLTEAMEIAERAGVVEPDVLGIHADAVEALVGVGDLDDAERLLADWEHQTQSTGFVWSLATSSRCRALLEAARGNLAAAQDSLDHALDHHRRLAMPFEHARTLFVAGQIQRRAKDKEAARRSLETAATMFEQLGATSWTQRARTELARVVSARTTAPTELTVTERRAAELAATGRTNREVAAALFVSPKTVEANLGRVYRKLGIRSRVELGVRLGTPAVQPIGAR